MEQRPVDVDQELRQLIEVIGLARFLGRINSGLIEPGPGYRAVVAFTQQEARKNKGILRRLFDLFSN